MDDESAELQPVFEQEGELDGQLNKISDNVTELRNEFQNRLVVASLRTEAVRAGMIDLDGLKMIDISTVRLGNDDTIIGGRKLMDDLRRNKPWLFAMTSSSSAAVAPASTLLRQKTALEMTDDEYASARAAVTKHHF